MARKAPPGGKVRTRAGAKVRPKRAPLLRGGAEQAIEGPEVPDGHDQARRAALRAALLRWFGLARRDLPWRRTRDPYAVWVSETMLQQTRVLTVVPYYERFLRELPTVGHLAEATEERVLALWSGLGYYRRARMLHAAAKEVAGAHQGIVPSDVESLRSLRGVGAYTAGAVASIAFGRRAPVVDGNVARVLTRLFAIEDDIKSARGNARVWQLAGELVPDGDGDPGDWNQALMELGATVCLPRAPACEGCAVRAFCAGREQGIAGRLPRSAPKKAPLSVTRVAVVLASERAVLLARRRGDVLFGGLWEPPTADGGVAELASLLGVDPRTLERAGDVVHVLSHRRMRVEVARGPLASRRRWPLPGTDYDAVECVALEDVGARAQATLARKVLAVAGVASSL
jgi:A/G-specific adenine glycosylase